MTTAEKPLFTPETKEVKTNLDTALGKRGMALAHEVLEAPNPRTYPREYFGVQVAFAQKWSELSGETLTDSLKRRTSLARFLPEDESFGDNPLEASAKIYDHYITLPESSYNKPAHAFGYDFYPERKEVKVHFANPERGTNPFQDEERLRADFRDMLKTVKAHHPEAHTLISASWIRSTQGYQRLFLRSGVETDLMAPDMYLRGDSVWGQFINRFGNINTRVEEKFLNALASASTVDDLIAAFPYHVRRLEDDIDNYYDAYDVA